jgi:hypothetical protein
MHPVYSPYLPQCLLLKLALALKRKICHDSTIPMYSLQTLEMVDMFIRNRALCRNQNVCWSVKSVETAIKCDLHTLRMQLYMVIVQGAFLDSVGASQALLQLPEHMELNPLLCGWVSPVL